MVSVQGITYYKGMTWNIGNETWGLYPATLEINTLMMGSSWIRFNDIGFNISSPSAIFINLSIITEDTSTLASNGIATRFYCSQTGTQVTFNLSGLKASYKYRLRNDSGATVNNNSITSSAGGQLQWKTTLNTATRSFTLYDNGSTYTTAIFGGNVGVDLPVPQFMSRVFGGSASINESDVEFHTATFGGSARVGNNTNWSTYWHFTLGNSTQPTNLKATRVIRDINLSWTPDPTNDKIIVRMSKLGYPALPTLGTAVCNITADNLYYYQTALDPGTQYYYSCWGYNFTNGYSSGHATATNMTLPGNITGLTLSANYSTSLLLAYNKGVNASHTVIYWNETGNTTQVLGYNGTASSATINNLTSMTGYLLHLYAYNQSYNLFSEVYLFYANTTFAPTSPTGFSISSYNDTRLNLSWIKGTGTHTVIKRRLGAYPTNYTNGTTVYNGTGTKYQDNGLTASTLYYYRAWSRVGGTYSDLNASANKYTRPQAPFNGSSTYNTTSFAVNFTWNQGNGNSHEVVYRRNTSYPIMGTSGSYKIQNSTATPTNYLNQSNVKTERYYSVYSYNATSTLYSREKLNLIWGCIGISVYNESNPSQAIGFNIEISNQNGSTVYSRTNQINTHYIDVNSIPYSYKTTFIVSNSSYNQRSRTENIKLNNFYNYSFYLPPKTTPGEPGEVDCVSSPYIDYKLITNPLNDVYVPLTYTVEFIQNVEVYNSTTSYWDDVNYTYNSNNTVWISKTAMDSAVTMARVTYYYQKCANTTASYMYYFQVIVDDPQGITLKNVSVNIKRYINTTGVFSTISTKYTDSNGKFSLFLLPGQLYKIICNKEGYDEEIVDYIPSTTFFGDIIIKMTISSPNGTTTYYYNEQIHWSGYIDNTTGFLYVNYTDDMNQTIDCTILVYDMTNGTLMYTYTCTGNSSFQIIVDVNKTDDFEIVYKHNHTYFGYKTGVFNIKGYKMTITTMTKFNRLFALNFGYNPFGWSNTICWLIILGCFFSFDRRYSFMTMFLIGFLLLIINYYIGFNTAIATAAGGVLPIIMIFFGILMLIRDRGRFGVDF